MRWDWLALAGLALVVTFAPVPLPASADTVREVRIEASAFEFSPSIIRADLGDRVVLEFIPRDVVHGLSIDGYAIHTEADPGQSSRLEFSADRPGSFRMRCIVPCGPLHPFMRGTLRVGPNLPLLRGLALIVLSLVGLVWARRTEIRWI